MCAASSPDIADLTSASARLDGSPVLRIELAPVLGERFLGRMGQAFRLVAHLDERTPLLVLLGMGLRLLHHPLDIGFGKTARGLDTDLLLLAGALVLGRDVDDAVGVDVEGDLDLRYAARRRRDADEIELAEQFVVGRHLALTLEDPDRHGLLIVLGGREHLALLGRESSCCAR